MKGILRVAWLLCFWSPLQRWLLMAGSAAIVAGHLGRREWPLAHVVLFLGLMLLVSPAPIVGGTMLRALSAPRTTSLIPYARLKLLCGVLLCLVALAAFFTAHVWLFELDRFSAGPASLNAGDIFLGTLAVATALLLGMFLLSSSRYTAFLWVAAMLAIWQIPSISAFRSPIASSMIEHLGIANLLLIVTTTAWAAFAAWYLRARRIAWPIWTAAPQGVSFPRARQQRIDPSRESSVTVHLLGIASIRQLAWRGLIAFVILFAFSLTTLLRPGARMPNSGASFLFLGFFAVALFPVAIGSSIARRSRVLWLGSGLTRLELFRTCERLTWRCFAVIGTLAFTACVAAWNFLPHQASNWPYLLIATLMPAVCGLYLGLMNVMGWRLIDVIIAALIMLVGLAGILAPMFANAPVDLALTLVQLAGLLGALGLRSIAQRRWRRIDWLICKPPRTPSQALRPVI